MSIVNTSTSETARAGSPDTLVSVRGLKVHFPIKQGILFERQIGAVRAVDGVDLDVPRGRTVGLVGESGCGKSTLGRAILRLAPNTAGSVLFEGEDVALLKGERLRRRRQDMQMVFQDPLASLNPRQSIETILTEPLRAHGIAYDEKHKVRDLLDKVGLPASASRKYPHEFSGGQRQRISIARAIVLEPSFVVLDEPTSALDMSVQAQIVDLLRDLQARRGLAYMFISHDLRVVRALSDQVIVMRDGQVVEHGPAEEIFERPRHPYTRALMAAAFEIEAVETEYVAT